MLSFQEDILRGIPDELPAPKAYDTSVNHAPRRKDILTREEKVLALKNALRYFPERHHAVLAKEFADELKTYGRIYMYRFRPDYDSPPTKTSTASPPSTAPTSSCASTRC